MASFKASFPSERASVVESRRRLQEFLEKQGLSALQVLDSLLAAGEALTNAVLYGASDEGFLLSCDLEDGALTIEVRDFGPGVSLEGKGQYIEPQQRSPGGLGIYIMRVLMDTVTYQTDGKGTRVTLVLRTGSATGKE